MRNRYERNMSAVVPLFSVTYADGGRIVVEIHAEAHQAIARRARLVADGIGRVVIAEQAMRIG